jgi:hypothetical protein
LVFVVGNATWQYTNDLALPIFDRRERGTYGFHYPSATSGEEMHRLRSQPPTEFFRSVALRLYPGAHNTYDWKPGCRDFVEIYLA